MSNHLAIATVTAVLQEMIQEGVAPDAPGTQVTTMRPDKKQGPDLDKAGINIYLYQTTTNTAWRNTDLRTRRPKGDLGRLKQVGLDLHYLFTFYGEEGFLTPQKLLGSTVRTLVDRPLLETEFIERIIQRRLDLFDSNLSDQVQTIRLVPSQMNPEQLSRVWSSFFQTPYALSLAYEATVILIEGKRPGRKSLPVLYLPQVVAAPQLPTIEEVAFIPNPEGSYAKILESMGGRSSVSEKEVDGKPYPLPRLNSQVDLLGTLIVRGQSFKASDAETQLLVGEARLTPKTVEDAELRINLQHIPGNEIEQLRAGMTGLKISQVWEGKPSESSQEESAQEPPRFLESNAIPIGLRPTIRNLGSVATVRAAAGEDGLYAGEITVEVDLIVAAKQKVFLLLNGADRIKAYVFRQGYRREDVRKLTFNVDGMEAGEYLVRIQIDGVESLLELEEDGDRYVSPKISIP